MDSVMLFCLVNNDVNDCRPPGERAFSIDISVNLTVDDLRNSIKAAMKVQFKNVDASWLTLWKVNINISDNEKLNAIETHTDADIKKVLDEAEKLTNASRKIDKIFPSQPADEHISILVQVPQQGMGGHLTLITPLPPLKSVTMNIINHEGIISLEQPFVKVPYEQLKKTFRTSQKYYEKELLYLGSSMSDLVTKSDAEKVTPDEAAKAIDAMVTRLQNLKRKLSDVKAEETLYTTRSKLRLDHLNELTTITTVDSPEFKRWSRTRLDRVLVDYLLRRGFTETANKVAKEAETEKMVDVELFAQASRIEEALQRHSYAECLQWCSDNKSNLRKMKSTLVFNLRLQEYIELVRARRMNDAIAYVRKYLTPWVETHLREIQQAMALMAFPSSTQCAPYKKLFDPARWHALVDQFRADNFALCSLPTQPLLSITLQAGLSALKTPQCGRPEHRNIHCPVCAADTLGVLAECLPLSHQVNSTLVCRISGVIMNWDNPPMALPNGQVYSLNALQDMAKKNNGKVTCPWTGLVCEMSQLKKVFIL